ncbi:hypothetical protein [Protofrankia coriariae]|nr:hypothetical protein [Protofrankia coriariae]
MVAIEGCTAMVTGGRRGLGAALVDEISIRTRASLSADVHELMFAP